MDIFKFIGNLLLDKEDKQKPLQENITNPMKREMGYSGTTVESEPILSEKTETICDKKEESQIESKVEFLKTVTDLITKQLDDVESNDNNNLAIWLDTDEIVFRAYNTEQYRQQIQSALINECNFRFESVEFRLGKPSEDMRCARIGESGKAFMQIVENKPVQETILKRASISIFGNAGSLLKEQYILSTDEMKEKAITVYNIGAGEFPQVPTGYRQNHIAIDDNPDGPMIEKNKYVSRMHAHIGYSEQIGFYLQVELDGTRLMGKRTRIFRGEQKIELDNPQIKVPLQNGDLIELGKAVLLRYEQL